MMTSSVIEVEHVAKRYRVGERVERYRTLRESMSSLLERGSGSRVVASRELWALEDVSFTVDEGEKLRDRSQRRRQDHAAEDPRTDTRPQPVSSRTRGRVGSLLEVGTGFHHELTGRENIYPQRSVLGMSRRDIRQRFDEIVAFSGVERHLDKP